MLVLLCRGSTAQEKLRLIAECLDRNADGFLSLADFGSFCHAATNLKSVCEQFGVASAGLSEEQLARLPEDTRLMSALISRFEPRVESDEDGLLAHQAFERLLEQSRRHGARQEEQSLLLPCEGFVRGVAGGGDTFGLLLLLLSPKTLV